MNINYGVPQGTILSCFLLLILYINGIEEFCDLQHLINIVVDGIIISIEISTLKEALDDKMQRVLKSLQEWQIKNY